MNANSSVINLQNMAMRDDSSVTEVLRTAFTIARKLNIPEMVNWIDCELNGYKSTADVPKYRVVGNELKFVNPYHGLCPIVIGDQRVWDALKNVSIVSSISEIISLIENSTDSVTISIKGELYQTIKEHIMDGQNFEVVRYIPITQIASILDEIKNRVLNWAIELEQQGIMGYDLVFTNQEKEKVESNTAIHIGNVDSFQGNLGVMNQSIITQRQCNIKVLDFTSLSNAMRELGCTDSDIDNLRIALVEDKKSNIKASKSKFGKQVCSWLGGIVGKAASGTIDIGVDVASSVLANMLNKYYGWEE